MIFRGVLLLGAVLFISVSAQAQELPKSDKYWSTYNMHFWEFDKYARALSARLPKRSMIVPEATCAVRYNQMYKDRVLNIVVGFGYTDETSIVRDPLTARALAAHMKQPCRPHYEVCGFTLTHKNPFVLTKQISDPIYGRVQVNVHIAYGAFTPDDGLNRNQFAKEQDAQSSLAEQTFFMGLRSANVALYSGHSRNGGGPDFRPPIMVGKHVNYPWYEANRPGLKAVINNLKLRPAALDLFGMFSCYSRGHFSGAVRAASPKTGTIFGFGESWFNADTLITGTINAILRRSCQSEFDLIFKDVEHRGKPQFLLDGFWPESSKSL